jgi:hypothetical protein
MGAASRSDSDQPETLSQEALLDFIDAPWRYLMHEEVCKMQLLIFLLDVTGNPE